MVTNYIVECVTLHVQAYEKHMFKTSFVPTNLFTFTVCLIITRLATSFQIDIVFLFWWQCDGGDDDDDDNSIDNCSEEVVLVKVMMMMMIYTFKYSSDSGSHNKFSFVEFCNSYRVILRKSPKYSIYFRDLPCWYWTVYIHMGFEVARLVRESFLLAVLVYIHIHTDTHTHTLFSCDCCHFVLKWRLQIMPYDSHNMLLVP